MANEERYSGVSMRDVRDSLQAVEDDLPVRARVVLFLLRPETGKPTLWLKAQAVDSEGRPVPSVPGHGLPWPHPDFRTVAEMMLFLLEHVYAQVEYQLAQRPPEAA